MKQIAIIGSTASGKTALALDIANKTNSIILSLDSLSVYKQIDIASAKPTVKERGGIVHFGINEVYPDENFDVIQFINCYKKAKEFAYLNKKNLIIVGGTGFYLKALVEGISLGVDTKQKLDISKEEAYEFLYNLDKQYMQKIASNDSYRIEKAYAIYKQTGKTPTEFFNENKKEPIAKNLKIFEITWPRDELKKRISLRTKQMINNGLIDEVIFLEKKYTRLPNCMSSIGIIETLEYLDGKLTKEQLEEKISINTAKLAKRQNTFNNSQFQENITSNIIQNLNSDIIKFF
ncbi:tRNA (adenosine(37)-N6)-dimethylallyltransferase MiaA [Malaciobacter molluscorum LMG 25693]|uniref:tRNA dimethylallyltransferase n=1 Tax=Malaciobacter molluscorum LMG 25693 TaxID=870501 RepID=A0A2G1DG40_9BACT|nr:tRNA (adenosine(37)-N6)-dimethylallyltransferase MiaA [Malaciobacter molluscorum]AXX91135.1 tRNA(i6A37) synthase [Malaciobacter molluscorum LMG 25693]PHO17420.1 tRNA (adenosine(37)-N6)-dimethylallyltransferase MiaA [Malaciobacter molluscorum LMG 25693]